MQVDSVESVVVAYARAESAATRRPRLGSALDLQIEAATSYADSVNAKMDVIRDHSLGSEPRRFAEILHRFSRFFYRDAQRVVFIASLGCLGSKSRHIRRRVSLLHAFGIGVYVGNLGRMIGSDEIASDECVRQLLRACQPRLAWVCYILPVSSTRSERRRQRRNIERRFAWILAQTQHIATKVFPWTTACPDAHIVSKYFAVPSHRRPHSIFVVRDPWWLDEFDPPASADRNHAIWIRTEPAQEHADASRPSLEFRSVIVEWGEC
jgi:hypothetical protein